MVKAMRLTIREFRETEEDLVVTYGSKSGINPDDEEPGKADIPLQKELEDERDKVQNDFCSKHDSYKSQQRDGDGYIPL